MKSDIFGVKMQQKNVLSDAWALTAENFIQIYFAVQKLQTYF